jgi:nitrous-oxide reductase
MLDRESGRGRVVRIAIVLVLIAGGFAALSQACSSSQEAGAGDTLAAIMAARELTDENILAAAMTYMPTGRHDEYYLFASGGHSGQVMVIGLPSMRILKVIAVFTPEPWQGWGYGDESNNILASGNRDGNVLSWGDTHHPSFSETNGEYDGEYLFINDKANARIAVINLHDFVTTQIVHTPLLRSDHGAVVTPNTEYVIEIAQYPVPLDGSYQPIETYADTYRGAAVFWKFDRQTGRIVPEQSWAAELPPYMQDIADAGKLVSDGWAFFNSINTELAFGGNQEGRPPLEEGASQHDMDYLHLFHWRRAEEVVNNGGYEVIQGMRVIRLETLAAEGLLYFVGEPKSPHGIDVAPNGNDLVVSGKLDTHVTVYDFSRMMALIEAGTFEGRDRYGIPILPFRESIRGQVNIGLGPLHTQFGPNDAAYTSLFLEPAVARWNLRTLEREDMINVHYNIGHIATVEGDTVSPDGRFLVAMNKWALDRFAPVGPLLPQNFQLIDISGERMRLLYDLPIAIGEPHYAQIISADKIRPLQVYSPRGINPFTGEVDPHAVTSEDQARIERNGDEVRVYMTVRRSQFTPDTIRVRQGDTVHLHLTNVEQAHDATHGFSLASHNIQLSLEPGEHANVTFVADRAGVWPMYCTEFCSALHLEMMGYFLVEPVAQAPAVPTPVEPPAAPGGEVPAPSGEVPAPGGEVPAPGDEGAEVPATP